MNITEKIISTHIEQQDFEKLVPHGNGNMRTGDNIAVKIDHTLTQDATGTMAYLQFETMGVSRVKTQISVSYIDHNTLQTDFKNADDHRYLQSVAARYGIWFSRAGNGICHQVHLERFGAPGTTLLGSDSHTPTAGGLGMLAIGAGGLDIALAMAGEAFNLEMPRVVGVKLSGKLQNSASAKDIILELLRRETVKGGVGSVYEYFGEGTATLSVPERATICNMGAELGATSSIFPSDDITRAFLKDRGRQNVWQQIKADENASYDRVIEIDLSSIMPLAACPHSPDNVKKVSELSNIAVDQVVIGSCTNSSIDDLAAAAEIVRGKTVAPGVSAGIACGSRTTILAAGEAGILRELLRSGFRMLECACGPCIGMGFAPPSHGVSLRTFNRNFKGRSGTADAGVYLVSPQTAAASAILGFISAAPQLKKQKTSNFIVNTSKFSSEMLIAPLSECEAAKIEIKRGPNIKNCPTPLQLADTLTLPVTIKCGNNITTDDIMPAGAKVLPLRSNIPEISKFVFNALDSGFYDRAINAKNSVIVGGINYGQGSSREHAALAPMFLGIRALIVKSFARIHKDNLINYGILPLTFVNESDYNSIDQNDILEFSNIFAVLETRSEKNIVEFEVENKTKGQKYKLNLQAGLGERSILRAGGRIGKIKIPAAERLGIFVLPESCTSGLIPSVTPQSGGVLNPTARIKNIK
ncbi:MAG: aconitate hydratase [Termitinemataceae bacterium]|nr:MAG: aconitate hydratase [Termitinemataceae bacterium]